MRTKECQNFRPRFFPLACALLAASLVFISCSSQSKAKHLARGEEYLQKRKYTEAVMEFRTVADIDRQSAEAHWGLARAFENLGQFSDALSELQQTAELNPANLEAKVKLGNYYLLTEPPQTREAQRIVDDVLARDAAYVEAHVLKASLLAAQKKSEKDVLDVLNYAVSLDTNRVETYTSLARYFIKINRPAEAESAINKGISVAPNRATGYIEYARFLDYSERASDAEAQFARAVAAEPQSVEARSALADFYLKNRQIERAEQAYKDLVEVQENSPEARVELADFYATVGRDDEAVNVFNQILTDAPEYARARYRLGEIHLERRENELVTGQIKELLKLNDQDSEALMLRARLRLQENDSEEAVADLEEILKKQPSQRSALFYMTQARLSLGQIDEARAFLGDLKKYHPNYLRADLLKIQASFASGEPENARREANKLFEDAKVAAPNRDLSAAQIEDVRVRALTARGLANLELGNLNEARADLLAVQKLSPNSAAAMVNLAKVFTAEKNFSEAERLYQNALTADAKNFDALNGLIGIKTARSNFPDAHATVDRAIGENDQKETLAALHYLKSNIFAAEKNAAAAESELKAAIETDEQYLPAYSAYAALLIARNETDKAVEQYNAIVERAPSASVYTLLGMLEESRNNRAAVEKNYRKALEIAPDSPIAANNLAWFIAESGDGAGNLDEASTLR